MKACLIIAVLFLAVPLLDAEVGLEDLAVERQERLYYDEEGLPGTVQDLIESDLGARAMIDRYGTVVDEKIKFNIILILDKKVRRGRLDDGERAVAVDFFESCLSDANPWVRTEAVYALGNAKGRSALETVKRHMDDPSELVTFHAIVACLMIEGALPDLTERQAQVFRKIGSGLEAGQGNEFADEELDEYLRRQVW